MFYAAMLLVGTVTGFLPVLPMMALYHLVMLKKDRALHTKTPAPHIVVVYVFCYALSCVLSVTSVPGIPYMAFDPIVNFIPFTGILTNFLQFLLNVLLFVPIGFLLPLLWKRFEKPQLTLLCGFLLSLSIELLQLFNNRITDIDDLLMNTAGSILGYLLFVLAKKIFPKISKLSIGSANHWKWEPCFCFGFVWISMLLIQPVVASWILTPIIM